MEMSLSSFRDLIHLYEGKELSRYNLLLRNSMEKGQPLMQSESST